MPGRPGPVDMHPIAGPTSCRLTAGAGHRRLTEQFLAKKIIADNKPR